MINLVKGAQHHPKPAIDKLTELYTLIRDEYSGILTKQDLSTMYYVLCNRIDEIVKEQLDNNGL